MYTDSVSGTGRFRIMSVIRGSAVDIVCPFPAEQIRLVYEWTHAYSDLTENDHSPETYDLYDALMGHCPQPPGFIALRPE